MHKINLPISQKVSVTTVTGHTHTSPPVPFIMKGHGKFH